ncbi:biopolymer transporter ExbD [Jiella avicenniae]|uniref:Biopolymer transporter ExbD n=1 Tax=Jiella avicenniae TaxID=2907202 RepID=A0A9X1T4A0_9HYPH|nr:biopolymer transporter ExbD [Jiella avicenniae]MCE7027657.1 biopolymer transporter ExbD [Jiella avicenniae]MCE7028699.1 biopolymer transporter ExbD [Jiella avicenniae]
MPTINIVFLLLLFFLLAGTLTAPGESEIDPARVGADAGERLPRPLLAITEDGTLSLDGRRIARAELAKAVADLAAPDGDETPVLYVLAARDLSGSVLVQILGEASAAGAATSLVVLNADGGQASP